MSNLNTLSAFMGTKDDFSIKVVYDFEDFESLQKFANDNDMVPVMIIKYANSMRWIINGVAYAPIKVSSQDYGLEYSVYENLHEYYTKSFVPIVSNSEWISCDTFNRFLCNQQEIVDNLKRLRRDEMILVRHNKYVCNVKKYTLRKVEDCYEIIIGATSKKEYKAWESKFHAWLNLQK